MPRVISRIDAPPPFSTIVGDTTAVRLPQLDTDGRGEGDHSSSASSSVVIVIIVISSAIIVSASLYLLLRFVSRRCHRSLRTVSVVNDVVSSSRSNREDSSPDTVLYERETSTNDLINSLPAFTFGSVTGNLTGRDCAVCLSKFEMNDQLRLLPLCCHAFHSQCIDAWLLANQTCPLCRSMVHPTEEDVLKIMSSTATEEVGNSFRIEIGSVSRRRAGSESSGRGRSYSIGSFDYIVDDGYEVPMESTHRRGLSVDKETSFIPSAPELPGDDLAAEVAGRSWLREYVDRVASISSRTLSLRSSGRFFSSSSRRSEAVVAAEDLETYRMGEEISELFRWLSGV